MSSPHWAMRVSAAVAVLALGIAAGPSPSAATYQQLDNCRGTVEGLLAQLDLGGKQVTLIEAFPRRRLTTTDGDDTIVGYQAGARLSGCTGWVRVEMDRFCRVRQSYTQGDCLVDGLPAYD